MNFSILTFGCKVNQAESESIISLMIKKNYKFIDYKVETIADIVIINSCTVTAESDRKLKQNINKIRRNNPKVIIVLTGCMPQVSPLKAKEKFDVEIIIGNSQKMQIPLLIEEYFNNKKNIFNVEDIKTAKFIDKNLKTFNYEKFRAFIKIQDGCNRFCSYCIIPYARGNIRSKPLEDIKNEISVLSKNNYKEVVLTGINLSCYGKDLNNSLIDAIKTICDCNEIKRIRLGSLEPDLTTKEFIIELSKQSKFCPQFHFSLQSGSNEILKLMRRRYKKEDYISLINFIKSIFPTATFTTDIIVGFPSETEECFDESLNIIKEVEFLKVHVFPYSIRKGTLAANFDNQVDKKIKVQRVQKMIDISTKTSKIVMSKFLNSKLEVLYESLTSDGFYKGYSKNYILVKTKSCTDIRGKILDTLIIHHEENFCIGEIIESER